MQPEVARGGRRTSAQESSQKKIGRPRRKPVVRGPEKALAPFPSPSHPIPEHSAVRDELEEDDDPWSSLITRKSASQAPVTQPPTPISNPSGMASGDESIQHLGLSNTYHASGCWDNPASGLLGRNVATPAVAPQQYPVWTGGPTLLQVFMDTQFTIATPAWTTRSPDISSVALWFTKCLTGAIYHRPGAGLFFDIHVGRDERTRVCKSLFVDTKAEFPEQRWNALSLSQEDFDDLAPRNNGLPVLPPMENDAQPAQVMQGAGNNIIDFWSHVEVDPFGLEQPQDQVANPFGLQVRPPDTLSFSFQH